MAEEGRRESLVSSKSKLNMIPHDDKQTENQIEMYYGDYTCPICLQLLVEPVVMPCEHELCKMCFTQNVQEANLQCPLCRIRISSWARKHARNGTLVNHERWELIKKLFPRRCEKRLRGEDDSEDDTYDHPPLKRILSENGAIRSEYEQEVRKIHQAREEEIRASEDLIHRLMEESQSVVSEKEQQRVRDEKLARELQNESPSHNFMSQSQRPKAFNKHIPNGKAKAKAKTYIGSALSTLEKWFTPTRKTSATTCSTSSSIPTQEKSMKDNTDTCLNSVHDQDLQVALPSTTLHLDTVETEAKMYDNIDPAFAQLLRTKQQQEEDDFMLAVKIQKELDQERTKKQPVERKKGTVDGYLLRNGQSTATSTGTSSEMEAQGEI